MGRKAKKGYQSQFDGSLYSVGQNLISIFSPVKNIPVPEKNMKVKKLAFLIILSLNYPNTAPDATATALPPELPPATYHSVSLIFDPKVDTSSADKSSVLCFE